MEPITVALSAAKILGGIFSARAAKRQSQNVQLQGAIISNLSKASVLKSATENYGKELVAANRSGGFSYGAFSPSFSNLAADLRQISANQFLQNQEALSIASAGRMSLLNAYLDVFGDLAGGWLGRKGSLSLGDSS